MAEQSQADHARAGLIARLGRTRTVVRGAMLVERLWPLALPLVVVASLFLSLAWFGVFRLLPDWGRLALLALFGICGLAAVWPLRLFRAPSAGEIDRRIERANQLEHAPVSAQSDRLAGAEDAFSAALWREHQKRMAERLGHLHGDLPQTSVPRRDPWGLRALAALLFVTALAYSTGPYGGRIADAFQPPAATPAAPARIDAWVTPPAYTGRAPIFLTADANRERQAFTVPQNSIMAVRVSGGSGEETLSFIDAGGGAHAIAPEGPAQAAGAALSFSQMLSGAGTVSLSDGGLEMARWQFSVVPDTPPRIRFAGEPGRAVNGALELAYEIEDDYGAVKAEGHLALATPAREARPLFEAPELPLSLPRRGSQDGAARTARDLTRHPWAGETVTLTLSATDAAGQTGESETKTFLLPQRPFTNPLARALIEQRRMLALDAGRQRRVQALMDALLLWPEETFDEPSHFLLISAVRSRLGTAGDDEALRGVVEDLWEIALIIEDGDLTAAERRLRQAQEALRQALENGASDEEIERLMDELRAAMQDYLREFAERALRNRDFAESQGGEPMRRSDLERMLDEIEDLAKSGARDQARDLLSQLETMMNNLQAMRPQPGQGGGQQSEMRQQMDRLGEIMRRQQELMNETFRLDQFRRGQPGQEGRQPGQQGEEGQGQGGMSPGELAEALRGLQQGQGGLRDDLQALMEALEGLGIRPGEGFGEAGEAMGEAEQSLGQGRGERAVGEQGRALEALRRGAQDMMNQMQQAMRGQQGPGQEGGRQDQAGRDPLGRPRATTGPDFGDTVDVPDEIDRQRAREILDAIRRRLGDALSPDLERRYLERLLDIQ
ncbi:TIGR02302 family protein [Chelativorans intermedius]|uniref:TIGR02302 family protein n=1 Tax=Chelativorans intermedius TaxID=515947 RepID=A0ABV6DAK0_9HYPH|nr:TIGR02302 family protein [Chelativorans intermedius]MCT8997961.1 TIGR02302 family protein [Chelativorans intermedius]